jgi:hypothetical protein
MIAELQRVSFPKHVPWLFRVRKRSRIGVPSFDSAEDDIKQRRKRKRNEPEDDNHGKRGPAAGEETSEP